MGRPEEEGVKRYLALWFQLGKRVVSQQQQQTLFPQPIFRGNHYSPEFERCWQTIVTSVKSDFYLEGTDCSIRDLLSSGWEIVPCARCEMPIALKTGKVPSVQCPCGDLSGWPNTELPKPRSPVDSRAHLQRLSNRLGSL